MFFIPGVINADDTGPSIRTIRNARIEYLLPHSGLFVITFLSLSCAPKIG